jgi:2-polyprenyl-3-methyl-5-hydroxy-6-metoxy-1,4-benzoquinol methylase
MSTNDSISKVQESWEGLGRSEPFWSVLTGEAFKSDKINHHAQQVFFDSGAAEIDTVRDLLRRADLALPAGKCLDYGCGLGRVTIHLAGLFDSVLGADISRPHLTIASDYASRHAINNIAYRHVGGGANELQDVLGQFSFIYSVIVLQHSPPAVINETIHAFGRLLAPGGVALFQLPTYHVNYDFDSAILGGKPYVQPMELHAVRQREVFAAMAMEGCSPMGVFEIDRVGAGWSSHYFLFRRPT